MKLVDRVAQCRVPFRVQDLGTGRISTLNNASNCAQSVQQCGQRFVLSDELTRLCASLAYSKGARTLACADLLRVPAERVWVEWSYCAWQHELEQFGLRAKNSSAAQGGRRGALIRSSSDGRRGIVRTFWTNDDDTDVLASSLEAWFDLDTPEDEDPEPPDGESAQALRIDDATQTGVDVLKRCFRFRYEASWQAYYDRAPLTPVARDALARHALGTIATDIPMVLIFFLLLATRNGLPRQVVSFDRLNRSRLKAGKPPLLDHIEVRCPLLPPMHTTGADHSGTLRSTPRLHRVRGHLFRRGGALYWRMPHLRGDARAGAVLTRTVTWTFEDRA
jgi:hypothetical protein